LISILRSYAKLYTYKRKKMIGIRTRTKTVVEYAKRKEEESRRPRWKEVEGGGKEGGGAREEPPASEQ